jgi:hypothetical protein
MTLSLHQFVIFLIATLYFATVVSSTKEVPPSNPMNANFAKTSSIAISIVSVIYVELWSVRLTVRCSSRTTDPLICFYRLNHACLL